MAQSVDTKIVELKFNNDNFQDKVDSSLRKLEQLNRDLDKVNFTDAFKNLTNSAKSVDVSNISDGVDKASKSFSKMQIFAVTAIANISNSIVNLGKKIAKNIISPITQGGLTRAMNIAQAKFQFQGMNVFSKSGGSSYKEVMDAVTDTAYGYDQAAKAASQLAASNVGVTETTKKLADGSKITAKVLTGEMTEALKGIAGVASMTGSDFDSIAQIFTRVAGQGRVMATDLNSIASRGLNAAAVIGASMGKTEKEIREMVSKGKVSFEDFSKAMSEAYGSHAKDANMQFTGALSNMKAALARIGADFYGPLLESGRDLLNSITPVINLIHDRLGGAIESTTNLITSSAKKLSQYIDLIDAVMGISMKGSDDWKSSHMNAWTNLADLFKMGDAYKAAKGLEAYTKAAKGFEGQGINGIKMVADYLEITEKKVKKGLKEGTIGFNTFYQSFKRLLTQSDRLMNIKDVQTIFDTYVRSCIEASDNTEEFTKVYSTLQSIIKGGKDIFQDIGTILANVARIVTSLVEHLKPFAPILKELIINLAKATVDLADFMANSKTFNTVIDSIISLIAKFFEMLNVTKWAPAIINGIGKAFDFIAKVVNEIDKGLQHVVETLHNVLSRIGDWFSDLLNDSEKLRLLYKDLRSAALIVFAAKIATALAKPVELLATLKNSAQQVSTALQTFLTKLKKVGNNLVNITTNVNNFIRQLTATLKTMQQSLRANILIKIGIAIAILAGAFYLLTTIDFSDPGEFTKYVMSFIGIAGVLVGVLQFLSGITKSVPIFKRSINSLQSIGVAMLLMATSIMVIAGALKLLSSIDENSLGRSFIVVESLLITLALIAKMLSGETVQTKGIKSLWSGVNTGKSIAKGLSGLVAMALAVKVLADAIGSLAQNTDQTSLLTAAAIIEVLLGTMAIIAGALSKEKPDKMVKGIGGLVAMAFAIRLLAKPINDLATAFSIDPEATGNAVMVIYAFLITMATIAGVLSSFESKGKPIKGALSMILMAKALQMVAQAIIPLVYFNWKQIAVSIGALIVALYAMVGAMALLNLIQNNSDTNLVALAASIFILAKALEALGTVAVLVGDNFISAAIGLGMLIGSLYLLIGALAILKKIPMASIGKLALILLELVLAVAGFGAALIIVGIGLGSLGMGLATLSTGAKSLEDVGTVLMQFGVILAAVVAAIMLMPESVLALAAFGIAMNIVAAAIQKAANGFETFATSMAALVGLDDELTSVAKAIKAFFGIIKESGDDAKTLGEDFEKLEGPLTRVKDAYSSLSDSILNMKENIGELLTAFSDSFSIFANSARALSQLKSDAFDSAIEAIRNFITSLNDLKNDATTVSTAVQTIKDSLRDLQTSAIDIKNAFVAFNNETVDAISKVATSMSTIADPINTLISAKDTISVISTELQNFITNISALGEKGEESQSILEGFSKAAAAMKEGVEQVAEPLDTLNAEMDKFHWALGDTLSHIGEGAQLVATGFKQITELEGSLPGTAEAISSFIKTTHDAMSTYSDLGDKVNSAADAIKKLGKNAETAIKSLSTKKMTSGGEAIADAISTGITKGDKVGKATGEAATKAVDKVKTPTYQSKFKSLGEYLVQGLIDGINAKIPDLTTAVVSLENLAERAIQATAKTGSPSKVWMQIGGYLGAGLAIGIRNSGERVALEAKDLASTSEDAVRSAIVSISNAINDDMNLNPVITPVVDLSNIDKSARSMSSRFGSVSTGLAGSISGRIQNGSMSNNATLNKLNKTLSAMTETMNSRSLNNYITVDGASDPSVFADDLIRSFRLNARTV